MPEEIKSAQGDAEPPRDPYDRGREFLETARQRFKAAQEAEEQNRNEALDDLNFRIGKQWPADIQTARVADGRPCLTMNRLPQFIRQVTNEQRQQRPAIQVNPVGSGSDPDVADVIEGIVRHIELLSDAEIAYDTAFEWVVTCGYPGFWRLETEYIDDQSFDQEIKIKRIKNPFQIYFDPSCQEPDYSDAEWAFEVYDLSREDYRRQYPGSALASLVDFEGIGSQFPLWASKDAIRVAKYWHIETEKRSLFELEDGTVTDRKGDGKVVKEREVLDRRVYCTKINAVEVLEDDEWPGLWIPLVPVMADDLDVNGKRYLAGMVRQAKDPQRQYNFMQSAATELIALAPKSPFIGAEGQFENHEGQWQQANTRNFAYLEYKPVSVAGQPAPPPIRQTAEPPIQAMMLAVRQADNDLKATTGIYDASLGQQGPEQSGKAILVRQKQGDISNLNYSDNLARSIRHTGRMLMDLIPHIYDAPRLQRIVAPDRSVSHVGVFNSATSGMTPQEAAQQLAVQKVFDIGTGRYDVTVSVGPSYQSKRQEAVASTLQLVQSFPQIMAAAGDLLVRNMDWPGAQEVADRLKAMLPPQLQQQSDDPKSQVQQLQSQLQQLGQQHEMLVKALNQANETINTRQVEARNKYDIALLQEHTKLAVAELQAKVDGAKLVADREIRELEMMHDAAHEQAMQAAQPLQPQQAGPPQPTNGSTPQGGM